MEETKLILNEQDCNHQSINDCWLNVPNISVSIFGKGKIVLFEADHCSVIIFVERLLSIVDGGSGGHNATLLR